MSFTYRAMNERVECFAIFLFDSDVVEVINEAIKFIWYDSYRCKIYIQNQKKNGQER